MTYAGKQPFVREELIPPTPKLLKVVRSDVHATLYKIVYHEGGTIPKELDKAYNRRRVANEDIARYNTTRKVAKYSSSRGKDKKNAKIKDEARV